MTSYAEIDSSRFPLVIISFTGNEPSEENFDQYLSEMRALYEAKEKLSLVFDARMAVLPSLQYQKKQASWLKVNEQLLKDYCAGTAYVINKKPVRVILRMIFAITPQPVPYEVCGTINDAEEWALSQLSP